MLGFDQLSIKVNAWLKGDSDESIYIQHFYSATWSIGGKIYAKDNHYNQPRFSNIAIKMNTDDIHTYETADGLCFAKVINNLILI